MTAPFSQEAVSFGRRQLPLARWRQAAIAANDALKVNPNDVEAKEALTVAREAIRSHVETLRNRPVRRESSVGTGPVGTGISAVMGFGQGASSGFADELSGMVDALFASRSGSLQPTPAYLAGRDQHRQFVQDAKDANPTAEIVGDVTGSVMNAIVTGRAVTGAVPAVGRALTAGSQTGANFGTRLVSAGAGATLAGVSGAARGAGSVDQAGLEGRLEGAATGGAGAAVVGFPVAYVGNAAIRGGRQIVEAVRNAFGGAAPEIPPMVQSGAPSAALPPVRLPESLTPRDPELAAQLRARLQTEMARRGVSTAPEPFRLPVGEAPPVVRGSQYPANPAPPAVVKTLEEVPAPARHATQAQLAVRQGNMAQSFLASAPTPQTSTSVRALFANMPAAERHAAMDSFLSSYAPGGAHQGWGPILRALRELP